MQSSDNRISVGAFYLDRVGLSEGVVDSGKSIFFLFNEGGESKNNSNLNYLLE